MSLTFGNGVTAAAGWGDEWYFQFTGTWAYGDTWLLQSVYQGASDYTIGEGQVTSNGTPSFPFTYVNRIYLANNEVFNFSDNSAPTEFEVQGPGAGFVNYLSQLGAQDTVNAFGQLQGRLAAIAGRSIQMWSVNADPSQFAIVQELDNIGTVAPLSVQNLGDFDCIFLDFTGIRSLRILETTLNAFSDDIGTQVDELVQAAVSTNSFNIANACGVVEPTTKCYWLYVGGTIFVLSRYRSSKISAWSTFIPAGNDNYTFTPLKFVVYKGQVYVRGTNSNDSKDYLYTYGGANGTTYDTSSNAQVTIQIPWMDAKAPALEKEWQSIDYVIQGQWQFTYEDDPHSAAPFPASKQLTLAGSASSPASLTDSSYDIGTTALSAKSTHISLLAVSSNTSTTIPAIFSSVSFKFNRAELE